MVVPTGKHNRRAKVGGPATSDTIGYSRAEVEFMMAMEKYQRLRHRRPPTCKDVIRVAVSLGYRWRGSDG